MSTKRWAKFLLELSKIFLLLALLAFLLPKLALIWGGWMSSIGDGDHRPRGNPMRVESHPWSEFVMRIFPN